jgi:hypothetical protein
MSEYRLPSVACPWCSKELDAATGVTGEGSPDMGDATLCINCGEWCIFDSDLTLRKPTDDEFVELAADKDCRRVRKAWELTQKPR